MSQILILENYERGNTGPGFWFLWNVTVLHSFLACIVCWQTPRLPPAHLLWKLLLSNSNQCCISSSPFSWRLRQCSKVLFSNTFCFTNLTCLLIFLFCGGKKKPMNQISIRIQEKKSEGRSVEHMVLWDLFDEEKFFDSSLTLFAISFHSATLELISATSWEMKAISMNYHSKCRSTRYGHKI